MTDLLEESVARVVATAVDWDTIEADLTTAAGMALLANSGADVGAAAAVAEAIQDLPTVPAAASEAAVKWAEGLVRARAVPIGRRGYQRTVASVAGWLMVGAAVDAPDAVAALLSAPDLPRTLLRLAAPNRLGPFGRYADGTLVSGSFREGGWLLVAPPSKGKTQLLLLIAASTSGAVVVGTPNRSDVEAFGARACDHDLLVYDPGGMLGDEPPAGVRLVGVDPMTFIHSWESAKDLGMYMSRVGSGTGMNEEFWTVSAGRLIGVALYAGWLGEMSIREVAGLLDSSNTNKMRRLLRQSERPEAGLILEGITDDAPQTAANVFASARAVFDSYVNAEMRSELLDIERFLDTSGTLVLLSDPVRSQSSVYEIGLLQQRLVEAQWERATQGTAAGPPMLLIADEVTRSPSLGPMLGRILAEGPSRRIQMVAATQNTGQFERAYGRAGAEEVLAAASHVVLFEGSMSNQLLGFAPFLTYESDDDVEASPFAHPALDVLGPSPRVPLHRITSPGDGSTVHVLRPGSPIRRAKVLAAHREPLWRLCDLDASLSRAGVASPAEAW